MIHSHSNSNLYGIWIRIPSNWKVANFGLGCFQLAVVEDEDEGGWRKIKIVE